MQPKNLADIPKAYNPAKTEDKWYKYWYDNNLYHSETDDTRKAYNRYSTAEYYGHTSYRTCS